MTRTPTVCVIADIAEDGSIRPHTAELVHAGRQVADALSYALTVVALSSEAESASRVATVSGIDRVISVTDGAALPYTSSIWSSSIAASLSEIDPAVVIFPGSLAGRDYAPRVAARLGGALAADVSGLDVVDGQLIATRSVLGGRVQTSIGFAVDVLPMLTIRPGAFPKAEPGEVSAPVSVIEVSEDAIDRRVVILESREHRPQGASLTSAKRIVSGGRGLQGPDAFSMLEELASVMDAAVGASGAVVGQGWRSHDDQVGSTGHTVSPQLYLAVGISGAPQHLIGMQGSEYVVAINRDPDAPIFEIAAFGIVGDLFAVVPALIEELRAPSA